MEEENKKEDCCVKVKNKCQNSCGACGGGIYGLAFIGALIFYLQNAQTFMDGLLGVLKALVWPAVLIYKMLEFLIT